jgi:hypothetical protein
VTQAALASARFELPPSGFLEENLEALALPDIARREIAATAPSGRIVHTSDLTPLIEVDGHLLGAPLPDDEIRTIVRRAGPRTAFIVFGMGMGHVARALRDQSEQPVLVYEPDPAVLRTMLEHGPTDLGGIHVITSIHGLMGAWVQVGREHLDAIIVRTPGYPSAYHEQLLALPNAVQDIFQRIGITQNTYEARARTWVEDILANLEAVVGTAPFMTLMAKYQGVPAFIVGAGPSLDKNVRLLEEASKKGIVFAVNSSAKTLARQGFAPHVLACIESMDSSKLLSELPFIDDVVRAFSLCAAPNILKTGKGPLLPIHEFLPQFARPLEELTGVPGVAVCGSVSTAAFSIAHALGCSPIVLLGQDLAYTSGRTHASGSWWEDSRATVSKETGEMKLDWSDALKKVGHRHGSEPLTEIPAWGGEGTVFSGVSFTGIRGWFESAASVLKEGRESLRLVNATEGGGRIDGFEEQKLEDVLRDLPERDISAKSIAAAAAEAGKPITQGRVADWAKAQARLTEDVRNAARRLRRRGESALGAIKSEDAKRIFKSFEALEKAETAMRAAVHSASLVDLWAHGAVTETEVDDPSADKNDSRAEAERATRRGIRVAGAIERSAAELRLKLLEAAERFASETATRD